MFFVDDDESEVGERGEDGGACPDDDVGLAGADASPLRVPLGGGQAGVEHGDAVGGEAFEEACDGLGREGDLGDEQEARRGGMRGIGCVGLVGAWLGALVPSCLSCDHRLHEPQVDLGLAAAGDAVEQVDAEAVGQVRREVVDDAGLIGGEACGPGVGRFTGGSQVEGRHDPMP